MKTGYEFNPELIGSPAAVRELVMFGAGLAGAGEWSELNKRIFPTFEYHLKMSDPDAPCGPVSLGIKEDDLINLITRYIRKGSDNVKEYAAELALQLIEYRPEADYSELVLSLKNTVFGVFGTPQATFKASMALLHLEVKLKEIESEQTIDLPHDILLQNLLDGVQRNPHLEEEAEPYIFYARFALRASMKE